MSISIYDDLYKENPPLTREDVVQKLKELKRSDRLDLSDQNLKGIDLTGLSLRKANLSRADLVEANLRGVDLREVNFSRSNLSRAILSEANLTNAEVAGAFLGGADLTEANLSGANLTGADLTEANLSGAKLHGTNLSKVYMSKLEKEKLYGRGAKGLNESEKKTDGGTSTFRFVILEEPLSARNLATFISAITELHTKYWLIQQKRFADLAEYTQNNNQRYDEEAHLIITKLAYHSPGFVEFHSDSEGLGRAVEKIVDAFTLGPEQKEAARLQNQATQMDMKLRDISSKIEIETAEQALQIQQGQAELAKERALLELEKQRVEFEREKLSLERARFDFEVYKRKVAIEVAEMEIEHIFPNIDPQMKALALRNVLPSLTPLEKMKGIVPALPPEEDEKG